MCQNGPGPKESMLIIDISIMLMLGEELLNKLNLAPILRDMSLHRQARRLSQRAERMQKRTSTAGREARSDDGRHNLVVRVDGLDVLNCGDGVLEC